MATHSSVLAWRIPGMGKPGGLPSMGSHNRTWLKRLSSSSTQQIIISHSVEARDLKLGCWVSQVLVRSLFACWHSPSAAAAKSLQSCPTLCDPTDGSPPGSPVPGIPQARTLEWVAISFSNAWKWKVKVKPLSCVQLFVTPWTAAHQAPPSMGFFRQEYRSGVPLPS